MKNFEVGVEITSEDLNKISTQLQKEVYEVLALGILQGKTNGFFGQSFKASYISSTQVLLKSGTGFMFLADDIDNTSNKPLVLASDRVVAISNPNSTNDRIDLVCVRPIVSKSQSGDRKYKDEFSDNITLKTYTISKGWDVEILTVKGLASPSPVEPDTPSGYLKVCSLNVSAVDGLIGQSSVLDVRSLLPVASSSGGTGTSAWDIIVGDLSTIGTTHESLVDATLDAKSGDRILVLKSESLAEPALLSVDDVEIHIKRGVTLSSNGASDAIIIDSNGCLITGGRYLDFPNSSVHILSTKSWTSIRDLRHNNCNILDEGEKTSISGTIKE